MVSTKANTSGYRGPALLIPKEGDEAIPVLVQFSVKQRGGLRSWDGSISSRSGGPLFLEPGQFTLRLPDGREGIAMVNRVALNVGSGGISETISFQGSGPSPLAD